MSLRVATGLPAYPPWMKRRDEAISFVISRRLS
jgi:hypothetical protein